MNSAELAQNLIERAKALQTFRIIRKVPEEFEFKGRVPYTLSIKDGLMTVTVHAVTLEEAQRQVDEFLENWS